MRNGVLSVILANVVVVAISVAPAANAQNVVVFGTGANQACADFIVASSGTLPGQFRQNRKGDVTMQSENKAFLDWASGFVSATNVLTLGAPDTRTSAAGIDLWLRNYCASNPTAPFMNAVIAYMRDGKAWPPDAAK
jgi:hypothetical protein